MKYAIHISKSANRDLEETSAYIAKSLNNKSAAAKLMKDVEDAIAGLGEFPYRFGLAPKDTMAVAEFRSMPVHNYLVIYVVREETATVLIVRFLYNRRNWQKLLTAPTE